VKSIRKPCALITHARFDEEGLVKFMEWLLRHRQTKGAETDKQLLMAIESQSFTLPKPSEKGKVVPSSSSLPLMKFKSFYMGSAIASTS
jgi:hypothetical protein